ncbi:MAG: helix-turn-helix domain-containing protein [Gaiellaceae bacterium]
MSTAANELYYPQWLEDVTALREILERVEAELVSEARADGRSWLEIGLALGVTRQSVHRKHATRVRAERAASPTH